MTYRKKLRQMSTHRHAQKREPELLIPAGLVVRVFNEATGADCRTMEETRDYIARHPEAPALLEKYMADGVKKAE